MEPGLPDLFDLIPDAPEQGERAEISVNAAELYNAAQESAILNDRSAENASYKAENPSRLHVLSKLSESPDQPEQEYAPEEEGTSSSETETGSGVHRFPALLGTMTHKLMEMLVTTGNQLDVRSAVGEIIREYRTPGTEGYESKLTEALLHVADTMRAGGFAQTNGLPQNMLSTLLSADEVYCEVPFSYMDEAEDVRTVWNGVMDVVYLKDGRWHIVDYKTNADGSDLDLRYQGQLTAYVKAFKATTGFEADAMTYHIDI
jgi:ATP-dependent exoDNAse (exonuclease V) beta subunit